MVTMYAPIYIVIALLLCPWLPGRDEHHPSRSCGPCFALLFARLDTSGARVGERKEGTTHQGKGGGDGGRRQADRPPV